MNEKERIAMCSSAESGKKTTTKYQTTGQLTESIAKEEIVIVEFSHSKSDLYYFHKILLWSIAYG